MISRHQLKYKDWKSGGNMTTGWRLQETHLKYNNTGKLKVNLCKKVCHTKHKAKAVGAFILISDKPVLSHSVVSHSLQPHEL